MEAASLPAEEAPVSGKTCPECSELCTNDAQFCSHCGFPVGAVTVSRQDPIVGSVLAGGYHVLELIGVGGMGRVYRAQQRALGRTVAVKLIHPHLSAQEKLLARFLTEARATSQLNHPHTVNVIDFGKTDQGQPYMVMEFLRGRNLAQVVAFEGLLPLPRVLRIVRQILLALGEAHAHDIIHRDLKPENVIVESLRRGGDFVKVVDFGLAKLKADEQPGVTAPGLVCGTPDYMAPEQGRGDPIDGRSDLYAVGVVFFWLLCGRLPFEASTPAQVVLMHISSPLPDPTELAPDREIPLAVLEVLYRSLEKDPDDRYPDAHTFVDAIDALIASSDRSSWKPLVTPGSPVVIPSQSVDCLQCDCLVPWANYCLNCGTALPSRSQPHRTTSKVVSLPFVEREPELGWLCELLERTRNQCVAALVMGEEGAGKTRLLEEFLALARDQGAQVLTGHSSPRRVAVSGFTLLNLLDQLSEEIGPRSNGASPLSLLRALDSSPRGLSGSQRRDAYAEILHHALEQASSGGKKTLVVALDDVDRIDNLSWQVLRDAAGRLTGSGILLLGTHGPAFHERWLTSGMSAEILALGGFPVHVASDLLRKNLSNELPLVLDPPQFGVPPLYIAQVLAFLFDGGSEPPSRLADLIDRRTTMLPSNKRAIVQALAVLGEQVPEELLASFLDEGAHTGPSSETTAQDRAEALVDLEAASFVHREPDETLSLAHPILYKLVLLAIPAEARRELHRRACVLLRKHGEPIEVLAEHAMLAQDPVVGLSLLEQAAARALRLGDDVGATHLLERGLYMARQEIFRGEIDDPLSAVVIFGRKLGELLKARGLYTDARGVLAEVLDSASQHGKDREEILALLAEIAQSEPPPR